MLLLLLLLLLLASNDVLTFVVYTRVFLDLTFVVYSLLPHVLLLFFMCFG